MYRVVIIGAGWSGISAAVAAKQAGADVTLIERTDMLLGLGNVGGIMRNNGRYTATEENIALGGDEIFAIIDKLSRHTNLDFPGHKHASLYDVIKMEPTISRYLGEIGVEVHTTARVVDVVKSEEDIIKAVVLTDDTVIEGDVFVDASGSTGPMGNCLAYGNGCAMCVLRCPAFGPRVSVTQKAGCIDIMGRRKDGEFGAFSGSCKLEKASLDDEIVSRLNKNGVVVVPLRAEEINREKLENKVCQQYALDAYAENVILLDTGHAKLMTSYMPLDKLRSIPGFENAKYVDPYAGGKGNSVRYLSVAERGDNMHVREMKNLLCAGEKSGLFVGHTEAISTGLLAGHNAARYLKGIKPLELPTNLAIGDLINFAGKQAQTREGLMTRYTFAGDVYFNRMKEKDLYTIDIDEINKRVKKYGLEGIYKEKIIG